jgi:hypothetical protein
MPWPLIKYLIGACFALVHGIGNLNSDYFRLMFLCKPGLLVYERQLRFRDYC